MSARRANTQYLIGREHRDPSTDLKQGESVVHSGLQKHPAGTQKDGGSGSTCIPFLNQPGYPPYCSLTPQVVRT